MWDQVSALAAVASLLVSFAALWVAISGARTSASTSNEALQTARQANDIALGRLREPSVVEFAFSKDSDNFKLNFTTPSQLSKSLSKIITIHNAGKTNIELIAIEAVGIQPLTYPIHETTHEIEELPTVNMDVKLRTALPPDGLANIDVRKIILEYLSALEPALEFKESLYTTTINIVLAPKSISESTAIGATSDLTQDDRRLLHVQFVPSIIATEIAQNILKDAAVQSRVLSP